MSRKRRRKGGAARRTLLLLAPLLALGGWWGWLQFQPASSAHRAARVVVPAGGGVAGAASSLQRAGVVRSALAFNVYARWRGQSGHIKAGRYVLSGDMTLGQILRELLVGPGASTAERVRVTIPEGYTLKQIADTLQAAGVTDGGALLQQATDRDAIAEMHADFPLPKNSIEGYLFPDTYFFAPHTAPGAVLDRMLADFGARFARPYAGGLDESGRSLADIVTIASLIEREAKAPADRPRIAGVIANRLNRGMKLGIDASVLYAIGRHKDRVTFKDVAVDSPYNTYRHTGLPPGPIANPGLSSLLAALRPEKSDYLYYVARPDGSHIFTRTVAEHEAAKREVRAEWQRLKS